MATWTYICPPCQRDQHGLCQDSRSVPCDCKKDGHGKRKDRK